MEVGLGVLHLGSLKINIDAALDSDRSVVGVGVIIRDDQGLVCTFSAQKIQAHFTPQLADRVALLLGIRFAADSYLIPASLKCDAAAVVSCVNAGSSLGSEFGASINPPPPRSSL
ncbi:hypothetical protein ACOSQ3_004865 [Xanthoceras sorbifolium]